MSRLDDWTDRILSYLEAHPGSLRRDIITGLGWEYASHYMTDILCKLRREGYVRNEIPGRRTSDTRWYFVARPIPDPSDPWKRQIAYLVRETGCTPDVARNALLICQSSTRENQELSEDRGYS